MILCAPTDIFPNINIPVVAVAWQYTGMNPEELEGRLTSLYERVLTALVDNVEHIESTTVNGQAIVKIYRQPGASLDTANAQVTAGAQTILRQLLTFRSECWNVPEVDRFFARSTMIVSPAGASF